MFTLHPTTKTALGCALLGVVLLGGVSTPATASTGNAAASARVTVIASGLNNPRDLASGPSGKIYVSEAGTGGDACARVAPGPQGMLCAGRTGSISEISGHSVSRVVDHLASVSLPFGEGVLGPDGLSSVDGRLFTVIGAATQQIPVGLPPPLTVTLANQIGHVLDVTPGHGVRAVADPGTFDYAWTARHKSLVPAQFPDANPYGLLAEPGHFFVTDAAANTLDSISPSGAIKVLAFVPNPPVSDAVPTCVARGPDGALYIGQLTGVGNPAGAASVYRYTPAGGLKKWKTGFSAITGCGFGSDGSFYVTELDLTGFPPSGPPAGAVVRIARNGTRTVLGRGKLSFPNGFLAGRHGEIYVTNWSVAAGSGPPGAPTGEVVRIG